MSHRFAAASFALFLFACASSQPRQITSYDLSLTDVERQPRGGERQQLAPATSNTFEDEYLKIIWKPEATQLGFMLTNRTDSSLRVLWDDASYVGIDGKTDRVMHQGVKFIDRSASTPPTLVIHGATLDDLIAPISNVYFREGSGRYEAGGWESRPLLPPGATGSPAERTIRVLLPFEINGQVHEYVFNFAVQSHTISAASAQAKADAIRFVRKPEEVAGCKELGTVMAHPPYIWPGDDFRQLRSKAAPLGADTVLVPGLRIGSVEGIAYRCVSK